VDSYSSPAKYTGQEQGPRRLFRVPVLVWGMNPLGSPFLQQVHTVNVGLCGACVEGMANPVLTGDVLGLKYRDRKARFRVVWVGEKGTSEAGKVELSPLDKTQNFWEVHVSMVTDQREPAERRQTQRYACKGSVQIRQSGTRFPMSAGVSEISLNGCYVELFAALPVGTQVDLMLQVVGVTVRCAGEVRASHPGVGMGIKFEKMSEADRGALKKVIARLSGST
jgi:PilZ domain-containing protein